jgi:hypothetical protein
MLAETPSWHCERQASASTRLREQLSKHVRYIATIEDSNVSISVTLC